AGTSACPGNRPRAARAAPPGRPRPPGCGRRRRRTWPPWPRRGGAAPGGWGGARAAGAARAEGGGASPRGLLVAGWGADLDPAAVDAFVTASGWPVLAHPLAGAPRGPAALPTYDGLLRAPRFAAGHRPDLVVRVGGAPTSKALTAWLDPS